MKCSSSRTIKLARRLRQDLTRSEVLLWARLRSRADGMPAFRRQHPIGPYVTDFCCSTHRLVVEIDGGVHDAPDVMLRDAAREDYLRNAGYQILRLTDAEVLRDPDAVAARIRGAVVGPPPSVSG
jgi:very-short-patch-repair endonuclease